MSHRFTLTPNGRLLLETIPDTNADMGTGAATRSSFEPDPGLIDAFARGSAPGLIALAAMERGKAAASSAEWLFWQEFADAFLTALAHSSDANAGVDASGAPQHPVAEPEGLFFDLTLRIPAMRGAEYASPEVFANLWRELGAHARTEALAAGGLKTWLGEIRPALHLLGRVTFHLAENKRSTETPFAFMATYTHRLSAQDKPVHLPLARALQEYAGAQNKAALRSLLEPVQTAAMQSDWTRQMLESRRIFQPQAWTPGQAHTFLQEIPTLEASGIITRIPNWWKNGHGPRPKVSVRVGENRATSLGVDSLLNFEVETSLDGKPLSKTEWGALLASTSTLVPLRGQWVEVDRDKLASVLDHWKRVEAEAGADGVSFLEAMRLLAGVKIGRETADGDSDAVDTELTADWSEVVAGDWLRDALETLRHPDNAAAFDPNDHVNATLRPYQSTGVHWLWFLQTLGLGACLADDMGLGKTIQVIALLSRLKHEDETSTTDKDQDNDHNHNNDSSHDRHSDQPQDHSPSLLIVPASLLANWKNEFFRFAPALRVGFAHPSESPASEWRDATAAAKFLSDKDVLVTTYGQATRLGWLSQQSWRLVVLDEAQAIKNPGTRQTRAIKELKGRARIALSGTPVENRLGDLWSLYDFLNPGLLGAASEFGRYVKQLQATIPPNFAPLRHLVRPYILRRLKTDRSIIADLPDKTEITTWCTLAKRQAALYEKSVEDLRTMLESQEEGIQRRGLILAFLTRFKQICNHPSHWLNDGGFDSSDSGKFQRLTELCEEIASRQEKVLVFSQFREMTAPLARHMETLFGRPGLILHGSTAVKDRQKLVADFQREDGPPFFILSLKAGGTGLTLTAASHVIHFDRWWNPAVENQATDRAYRIGQKRNVLVHKFVCRGTIEERINALIAEKANLAESVLGAEAGAETLLTEMSNDELLKFVSLDLKSAITE